MLNTGNVPMISDTNGWADGDQRDEASPRARLATSIASSGQGEDWSEELGASVTFG
jgi:hypothetical protein